MKTQSFKSLIDEAINYNNTSISSIAAKIDVNRTTLQHCIAGRRTLPYDKFEEMMQCLKMPESLEASIREEFAKMYYGTDDYLMIMECFKKLKKMAEFQNFQLPKDGNFESLTGYLKDADSEYCCVSSNEIRFFNSLIRLISCELIKCSDSGKPQFYTNYDITNDCLRMVFLTLVRFYPGVIDLNHIIITKPLSYEKEEILDLETDEASYNSDIVQDVMNIFFYQYEFAGFGYNTYNYVSNISHECTPMPYFIATSDKVLFFSEDLQLFNEMTDADTCNYMSSFFDSLFRHATPFCKDFCSMENYSYFTSLDVAVKHDLKVFDLSPNICLPVAMNEQIFDEALPVDIPHRAYFVKGLSDFFSSCAKNNIIAISSLESIMNFVAVDEEYCSHKFVTFDFLKISPENKYKILKRYLELVDSGTISCYFYINDRILMPDYFHINAFENDFVWAYNIKIMNPETGIATPAVASFYNPIIAKHLRNVSEYVTHSKLVNANPTAFARSHIENAMLLYKNKHGFED